MANLQNICFCELAIFIVDMVLRKSYFSAKGHLFFRLNCEQRCFSNASMAGAKLLLWLLVQSELLFCLVD